MIHEEQLKIIQNLMLKHKETKEEHVMEQILERIDDTLIGMVCNISKMYYFTEPNIQDLYQCGILGIYKAIDSLKETDDSKWLMRRIFTYVRKEIFQEYGEKKCSLVDLHRSLEKDNASPVDGNLIQEDLIRFLASLIAEGIIDKKDLKLLTLRFVDKVQMKDIVSLDTWGKTWSTVNNKIEILLNRIQKRAPDGAFM